MRNIIDFFIETFNLKSNNLYESKFIFCSFIFIVLVMRFLSIQTSTIAIIAVSYYIHKKYIEEQNKVIEKDKKHGKFKRILKRPDKKLYIIFKHLHKFKKYSKKTYNSGKSTYNGFLKTIHYAKHGCDNYKHLFDVSVLKLNESMNLFMSLTHSLPVITSYIKGQYIRDLELDHRLSEILKELYEYSIHLLENMVLKIQIDWKTNKNTRSADIRMGDFKLPKPSDINDILYSDKFTLYNI